MFLFIAAFSLKLHEPSPAVLTQSSMNMSYTISLGKHTYAISQTMQSTQLKDSAAGASRL